MLSKLGRPELSIIFRLRYLFCDQEFIANGTVETRFAQKRPAYLSKLFKDEQTTFRAHNDLVLMKHSKLTSDCFLHLFSLRKSIFDFSHIEKFVQSSNSLLATN